MANTQYVGSRYVPVFADPLEWNSTRTYEPLTIVEHEGNSYTSAQYVPKGVDISNESFWKLTGNYNAQVDSRLSTNETAMNTLQTNVNKQIDALSAETQQIDTNKNDITTLKNTKSNKKKYMLLFGDSWTDPDRSAEGTGTKWYVYVCKELQLEPLNYAKWGDTFGSRFNAQLTRAKNEISDDVKADITDVVIYGGVNNITSGDGGGTIASLASNFVASVYEWIPTARITIATPNSPKFGSSYMTKAHAHESFVYKYFLPLAITVPCNIVYAYYWTFGFDAYISDNIHPNEYGNKLIAGRMLQALRGGDCERVDSYFEYKRDDNNNIVLKPIYSNCPGVPISLNGAILYGSEYAPFTCKWYNNVLTIQGNLSYFTNIEGSHATVELNLGKIQTTREDVYFNSSIYGFTYKAAFNTDGDYVYTFNIFMLSGAKFASTGFALIYLNIYLL